MDKVNDPLKWNVLKEKLKLKFPQLTEADLHYQEGKEQDMLSMLAYKLRRSKQQIREIIARL